MMMTELLTTSNTTACTTTAPCLHADPSVEDKEHMVDHWKGLLESSVMPILKTFFSFVEGKAAAQRAKRDGINVYLYKFKWIIPKLRGGGGCHFHTLSWLSVSPQVIQSFDMVCSSSVCASLPFMLQIK